MDAISLFIVLCELILWALFWYYVVDLLTMMPDGIRLIFKGIIIMLAIAYSLKDILAYGGGTPPRLSLSSPTPPNIIAPERR
jgi:hypothetical protein